VLTLFERQGNEDLPYFLGLMDHLERSGLPSARPVADKNGRFLTCLNGRPTALVQRLPGASIMHPEPRHCGIVGATLARMHAASQSFERSRANSRGRAWWSATSRELLPRLSPSDAELLRDEVAFQDAFNDAGLPLGVIHADLFRDNALFVHEGQSGHEGPSADDKLTGVIDFYYACNDVLVYDLAVTVNDWCATPSGALDGALTHAVLAGYAHERAFTEAEHAAWPAMLRAAALRFWVSRLYDHYFPRDGEMTQEKDPEPFRRILANHRGNPHHPLPQAQSGIQ
jgi:homoserine kinase type II